MVCVVDWEWRVPRKPSSFRSRTWKYHATVYNSLTNSAQDSLVKSGQVRHLFLCVSLSRSVSLSVCLSVFVHVSVCACMCVNCLTVVVSK